MITMMIMMMMCVLDKKEERALHAGLYAAGTGAGKTDAL